MRPGGVSGARGMSLKASATGSSRTVAVAIITTASSFCFLGNTQYTGETKSDKFIDWKYLWIEEIMNAH